MTEAPAKPNSPAIIKGQNGKHAIKPPLTGAPIELPPDFWKGCDAEGRPRDPGHPWHWNVERKDS